MPPYVENPSETPGEPAEPWIPLSKRRFTYMELKNVTNNFSRVIGRGGFGVVYHGYLDNETEQNVTEVAVKVCHQISSQGTKQLYAEVSDGDLLSVFLLNINSAICKGYKRGLDGVLLIKVIYKQFKHEQL